MKQKLSLIFMVVILIVIGACIPVNAALDCKVNVTASKTECAEKEKFTLDVKLENVQTENGIMAFSGTLSYDKESLKMTEMIGADNWAKPTYNEENGKFVMDSNNPITEDSSVMKVTFEVLEGSKKDLTITFGDINVANGVDNPVIVSDKINQKITVKSSTSQDSKPVNGTNENKGNTTNPANSIVPTTTNTTDKTNTTNKTNTANKTNTVNSITPTTTNNTANTALPHTGIEDLPNIVILIVIATFAVAATKYYLKLRRLDDKR